MGLSLISGVVEMFLIVLQFVGCVTVGCFVIWVELNTLFCLYVCDYVVGYVVYVACVFAGSLNCYGNSVVSVI